MSFFRDLFVGKEKLWGWLKIQRPLRNRRLKKFPGTERNREGRSPIFYEGRSMLNKFLLLLALYRPRDFHEIEASETNSKTKKILKANPRLL